MDIRNLNLASRPVSELFGDNPELLYEMPKFQREYVWDKLDWSKFFKDLADTTDEEGHFMGSIIGIEPKTVMEPNIIVIDGQQRLTTISLYLAALFSHIRFYRADLNEDQQTDFTTLKRRLVQKSPGKSMRVIPQNQNSNFLDYRWLLGDIDVTVEKWEKPDGVEKRKLYRAYKYFYSEIDKLIKSRSDKKNALFELVDRMMAAILVVITVKSYSDAFQLFESLNNRGQDLNKTDLLKNIMLSRVSEDVQIDDYYYSKWTQIIGNIGDTVTDQERFFRNNYNAFRRELNGGDISYPISKLATQSNLLDIYAELTSKNPKDVLETVYENSKIYALLTLRSCTGMSQALFKSLRNLNEAEGSTAIVLLMHLMKYHFELELSEKDIISVIDIATKFQVRRNMTKMPPTNQMIPFYSALVQEIDKQEKKGPSLLKYIEEAFRSFAADDASFEESLLEDVYQKNKATITLILRMYATAGMTIEDERDLWKMSDSGMPVWTIEHILPQGDNLPKEWIDMVGQGDKDEANRVQKLCVHTLGNLTITGFNSALSNHPFIEKRDKKNEAGKYIGYRNGLNLNEDVCDKDEWTEDVINARTKSLVGKIVDMFSI